MPASAIDNASQCLEEFGNAVHLIKDNELVFVVSEILLSIAKTREVGDGLEVQVNRGPLYRDFQGQRRLPHLARSKQAHGGIVLEEVDQAVLDASSNHPCNYGSTVHNYKENGKSLFSLATTGADPRSKPDLQAQSHEPWRH